MSAGISSVLPSATYAGALTEFWSPAGAGGGGGGQPGVTQIVAGNNITISPGDGEGVVTINATGGGGGGGVTEILAVGDGIAVSAPTGIVNISNTGVTSLVAGAGIAVSAAAGAVTVSNTASSLNISYTPPANIPNNTTFLFPYEMTAPGLYFINLSGYAAVNTFGNSISASLLVAITAPNGAAPVPPNSGVLTVFQNTSYPPTSGPPGFNVQTTFSLTNTGFPYKIQINFNTNGDSGGFSWAGGQTIQGYVSRLAYPVA